MSTFWGTDFGADSGLKDPKRNFRFIVTIGGLDTDPGLTVWWAKSAAKPSFAIAAAEHKYLNHTFYYPGSVTWNDVTITMVDPVNPDVSATFADIISKGGYSPPATSNAKSTMSKATAASALGTVTVEALDAQGATIETWSLMNAWITDIKFGDTLEYGNDELTTVDITLKYDWATLKSAMKSGAKAPAAAAGTKIFDGATS